MHPLGSYPSTQARKSLPPSQLSTLNQTISTSLLQTLALPPTKRDTPATRDFVASYAKDTALQTLKALIGWDTDALTKDAKTIRKRTLLLAEKIASSSPGLDIQSLLDLAIIYAPTNISHLRATFVAALQTSPELVRTVEVDLVPAFTQLLTAPSQGLYAIRKTSHCIAAFLQAAPSALIRPFAHSKPFVLALATTYDNGLTTVAHSYGGLASLQRAATESDATTDEWEPIWVETKVSLMDAFHLIITTLLQAISSASGRSLAAESERTFDIVFTLLNAQTSPASSDSPAQITPFLDRSLLADYQHAYSLADSLAAALRHTAEKDARLDLLESTLQFFNTDSDSNPGVLKILLRSSGIPPGIDNLGNGSRFRSSARASTARPSTIGGLEPSVSSTPSLKGKSKVTHDPTPSAHDPDMDLKVTQVLDILPDYAPTYIRVLLSRPEYGPGDPERVVAALLEGLAPGEDTIANEHSQEYGLGDEGDDVAPDKYTYNVNERRNVFDDEDMDLQHLRFGKKTNEGVLQDRSFIEQMKADILRRAEAISDDSSDDRAEDSDNNGKGKSKAGVVTLAFDEDDLQLDGPGKVKVLGDGEDSADDGDDADDDEGGDEDEVKEDVKSSPETILELAYLEDPALFDRDAITRRGKRREDLRKRTGWENEQIEGWRIMLERNPRKDKILAKHEFSGNRNQTDNLTAGPSSGGGTTQRGRGQGRGRGRGGRGGGGARGGGGGGGGEGANSARERAWKDKNKASRGNHNRKRGHDKKMARGFGTGPPT